MNLVTIFWFLFVELSGHWCPLRFCLFCARYYGVESRRVLVSTRFHYRHFIGRYFIQLLRMDGIFYAANSCQRSDAIHFN